jgi:hypothetical protein
MALLPLNTFKTKTAVLTTVTTASTVYTAPIGVTAIILMANVANVDPDNVHLVTMSHYRNLPVLPDTQGNGGQAGNVTTEQVFEFPVPNNNAASLISGKLIIESLDSIIAYSDAEGVMKLTLSVLETANQ